jgi:hypothetical protein
MFEKHQIIEVEISTSGIWVLPGISWWRKPLKTNRYLSDQQC